MKVKYMLPPDGEYKAVVGGYVSKFQWGIFNYEVKFPRGVRGIGISDTITVKAKSFNSAVLGEGGELNEPKSEGTL